MIVAVTSVSIHMLVPTKSCQGGPYRALDNALNQDQAPSNNETLDRVGERVRLVRPCDIGRGDQEHSNATVSWRADELMDGPILQHKAGDEHEDAKCPKDCDWGNLAILAVSDPQPSQQHHGQAVDGP